MLGRILLVVATAVVGGGIALGRHAINKRVAKEIPTAIETARKLAEAELHREIKSFISEKLFNFCINISVKAGLVGSVYLMWSAQYLTDAGFRIVIGVLLISFVVRDVFRTLPFVMPALMHVRKHNWRPRTALKELIAGIAFERAYARAMVAMETGPNRAWLALSKYSTNSISEEVGAAVAEVARNISFSVARWRFVVALILSLVMLLAYASFLYILIHAV